MDRSLGPCLELPETSHFKHVAWFVLRKLSKLYELQLGTRRKTSILATGALRTDSKSLAWDFKKQNLVSLVFIHTKIFGFGKGCG